MSRHGRDRDDCTNAVISRRSPDLLTDRAQRSLPAVRLCGGDFLRLKSLRWIKVNRRAFIVRVGSLPNHLLFLSFTPS